MNLGSSKIGVGFFHDQAETPIAPMRRDGRFTAFEGAATSSEKIPDHDFG